MPCESLTPASWKRLMMFPFRLQSPLSMRESRRSNSKFSLPANLESSDGSRLHLPVGRWHHRADWEFPLSRSPLPAYSEPTDSSRLQLGRWQHRTEAESPPLGLPRPDKRMRSLKSETLRVGRVSARSSASARASGSGSGSGSGSASASGSGSGSASGPLLRTGAFSIGPRSPSHHGGERIRGEQKGPFLPPLQGRLRTTNALSHAVHELHYTLWKVKPWHDNRGNVGFSFWKGSL